MRRASVSEIPGTIHPRGHAESANHHHVLTAAAQKVPELFRAAALLWEPSRKLCQLATDASARLAERARLHAGSDVVAGMRAPQMARAMSSTFVPAAQRDRRAR